MHTIAEGCTNKDKEGVIKQDANGQNSQNKSNKPINYFFSSANTEADNRESNAMMQKIHNAYSNVFTGIECFKGTFHYSLNPTASHTKCHQGM